MRGGAVRLGTRTVNLNRRGPLFWPTQAKVVRFEPHREFALRIRRTDDLVVHPRAHRRGGTRVTQRREAPTASPASRSG